MISSESPRSKANVITWLLAGCALIFLMVIVGGITRLTGSGLSITQWKVVTGTIPPLTEQQWVHEFEQYSQTPQFNQINSHFGVEEFKSIYWWEYIHRLIGRLIGIVFLVPFIYFIITKQISRTMIWKSMILFFMGGLQGFVGWYMVKSGLVNEPSVSHYRLALHLSTAFLTFGLTFWFALDLIAHKEQLADSIVKKFRAGSVVIFLIVFLQIILGAFVAGLDAGFVYNTFPKMGETWIAEAVPYVWNKDGFRGLIDSLAGVQFLHRYMAYLVLAVIVLGILKSRKLKNEESGSRELKTCYNILGFVVLIQFLLGVFTLIYKVPVTLGVIHQATAFLLFAASIYLMHFIRYTSSQIPH